MPDSTRGSYRHRIDVSYHDEVRYWASKFGVTPEALRCAVLRVGVMADDVERDLAERAFRQGLSRASSLPA